MPGASVRYRRLLQTFSRRGCPHHAVPKHDQAKHIPERVRGRQAPAVSVLLRALLMPTLTRMSRTRVRHCTSRTANSSMVTALCTTCMVVKLAMMLVLLLVVGRRSMTRHCQARGASWHVMHLWHQRQGRPQRICRRFGGLVSTPSRRHTMTRTPSSHCCKVGVVSRCAGAFAQQTHTHTHAHRQTHRWAGRGLHAHTHTRTRALARLRFSKHFVLVCVCLEVVIALTFGNLRGAWFCLGFVCNNR